MDENSDFERDQRKVLAEVEHYVANEPSSEEEPEDWGPIVQGHPLHSAVHEWQSHFPKRVLPPEGKSRWKALLAASRNRLTDEALSAAKEFGNWAREVADPEPRSTRVEVDRHYANVLSLVAGAGLTMEKSPKSFHALGEEDLRHQLVAAIGGSYPSEVSGETFNRTGKTDIRVCVKGYNVFVAECAVWDGADYFKKKVSQLLGYLGARDTHVAVIMFSRNKNFSQVREVIEQEMTGHPNYTRTLAIRQHPQYVYRHPQDEHTDLIISALVFDLAT